MQAAIMGKNMVCTFEFDGALVPALSGVDMAIEQGEKVAIIGQNGCGKSTLVKHFNGLIPLEEGTLVVNGIDARDEKQLWQLRRLCGMVFQNPDNQFVSSIVEEDIAFGLENHQVPREDIPGKVREALKLVGMEDFEKRSPHSLSGGQKQRIALAGVLALNPEIIIFDEVTSMLDPQGRDEMLGVIRGLSKTVIMITHYIKEAVFADKVVLMHQGKVLAAGTPHEILGNAALVRSAGLVPPIPVLLYHDLKSNGIVLARCPITEDELVEELCRSN